MPLASEADFNKCLLAFFKTETGEGYLKSLNIFYDEANNRIKYMKISAQSIGGS